MCVIIEEVPLYTQQRPYVQYIQYMLFVCASSLPINTENSNYSAGTPTGTPPTHIQRFSQWFFGDVTHNNTDNRQNHWSII
jgi:hypothetical protein